MIDPKDNKVHDCNNMTCRLLNPSLEGLLSYESLNKRVANAEKIFFDNLRHIGHLKTLPLGLFGWTRAHNVFQLLNIEFIKELVNKIEEINPEIILEVGAGEGLLGKYLSKDLKKDIILTDDYSWWDRENLKIENKYVIKKDYKDAIKEYNPDLIIASWIPYKENWTKDFRKCKSVKGYILIGEGPGGCTGSDMDWITPWIRHDLYNVEKYGICRSDHGFDYGIDNIDIGRIRHTNVSFFERS